MAPDITLAKCTTPTLHRRKRKASILLLIIVGMAFAGAWTSFPVWVIVVQPKEYTVTFGGWGSVWYDDYTDVQRDAMNRHNFTIIGGGSPYSLQDGTSFSIRFLADMQAWKTNYPNIRFEYTEYAVDGQYPWDGNIVTILEKAKKDVTFIIDHDLTNVQKITFDIENPYWFGDENTSMIPLPYEARHQGAITALNEWFTWMASYGGWLETSLVTFSAYDVDWWDGDSDLQEMNALTVYDVPQWDEYAPMLYRASFGGKYYTQEPMRVDLGDQEMFEYDVDYSYEVFLKIQNHRDALRHYYGDTWKAHMGMTLGILNFSAYGRDNVVYEYGTKIGTGYDVLVRDILMCKHFEVPTIDLYQVTSLRDIHDVIIEGGLFDAYGDDILDRLNNSVNGINATRAFPLWVAHYSSIFQDADLGLSIIEDWAVNFARSWQILSITIVLLIALSILWTKYRHATRPILKCEYIDTTHLRCHYAFEDLLHQSAWYRDD